MMNIYLLLVHNIRILTYLITGRELILLRIFYTISVKKKFFTIYIFLFILE